VILTQPIYLGVNDVTQAEYEKLMGVNPSGFAPMGEFKEAVAGLETAEHPVERVSWNDAAEFAARLSKQEKLKPFYFRADETITPLAGTGYRLPTEAEWEFACRAGTATRYWIGDKDEDLVRAGWFNRNSGERTHAAGELKANPFGLADMHGNVWKWIQDGWDASCYGQFQEKPAINPHGPSSAGSERMLRGGHWSNPASTCRSSHRYAAEPTIRGHHIGFRVALLVDAVTGGKRSSSTANSGVLEDLRLRPSGDSPQKIALDLSPPKELGTWDVGPEPPWFHSQAFTLSESPVLPGLIERPRELPGIKRWNVDTVLSRGGIAIARFSPDGQWLATGSGDGHVRIYDAASLQLQRLLPGRAMAIGVVDLAWHPDSDRLVVAADYPHALRIFTRSGTLLFEDSSECVSVAWSPDGQRLATGRWNGVQIRQPDGAIDQTLVEGPSTGCHSSSLVWSPDQKQLACFHRDGKVRLWEVATGNSSLLAEDIPAPTGIPLAWGSRDWIALCDGKNLRLYGPDRKLAQTVPYAGMTVAWHPDGERVLLCPQSYDYPLSIWDCAQQKLLAERPKEQTDWILAAARAFDCSPNGQQVVLGHGLLRVYSSDLTKILRELPAGQGFVTDLAWSPDGQALASATWRTVHDGSRLWSSSGKGTGYIAPPKEKSDIHRIAWSPDGQTLLGASRSSGIYLSHEGAPWRSILPIGAAAVAWSPEGKYIAVGAGGGKTVILDPAGGTVAEMTAGTEVCDVAWSAATNLLAVHCGRKIFTCDPAAGWVLNPLTEVNRSFNPDNSSEFTWSPHGEFLALFLDGWFRRDGTRLADKNRHQPTDWRADGKQFAARDWLSIYEHDGTLIKSRSLDGAGYVVACRWHPQGRLIASGTNQGVIAVCDATNLQPYWQTVLLPNRNSATFSASGELLDGDAAEVDKLLVYYVERQGGTIETLTPPEFRKLLPSEPAASP
jgi:WD40 repeat protein